MSSASDYPEVPCVGYDEVRASIESGDILLCSGTSIFARLIQHATGSVWSHVGFLLRLDNIDRIMALESVESRGVQTVPLAQYVYNYNQTGTAYKGRVFIARHHAWAMQGIEALCHFSQSAIDLFGSPYDTQQIVSIAARIVAARIGIEPNSIHRNRAFICSEYAEQCYASVGIVIPYDTRGYIAPKDFAAAPEVKIMWEIDLHHES